MNLQCDFLVIGSGVAGLMYALKVADHGSVIVATKKKIMDSNTAHAQGGIASVLGRKDSFDLHIEDTMNAGGGISHREVAKFVVQGGPARIRELLDMGVNFDRRDPDTVKPEDTDLDLTREGGHSRKRIVHALDMTGREMETVLVRQAQDHPNITVLEHHIAIDLITRSTRIKRGLIVTTHEDDCCGAYVLDTKAQAVKTIGAKVTLLATGGAGKVYPYTSNPDIATGDGIAMSYRAGTSIANMEFVQFHPTCLYHPEAKNFLISEAVRGEGGVLIDKAGRPFMEKYSDMKDLACRDVVSRAIDQELKQSGDDSVFLDISHKDPEFVKRRFPNLYNKCMTFGIDMTVEPVPVVPAAHYICGGVATDLAGRTEIQQLYAIGETACTGLHGANRLASNSLLEALVYAHSAAEAAVKDSHRIDDREMPDLEPWDDVGTTDSDEAIMVAHNWDEIRRLMWNYVGIVRSDKRLERAWRRIEIIRQEIHDYYWGFKITSDLIELRNIVVVAELIIRSAIARKESRGLHYNIAYPESNDVEWSKDTVLKRPFAG